MCYKKDINIVDSTELERDYENDGKWVKKISKCEKGDKRRR